MKISKNQPSHATEEGLLSTDQANALFDFLQSQPGTGPSFNFTKAWGFNFSSGSQDGGFKNNFLHALAVHSGDVRVGPVPAALRKFGSGLLGLAGVARRKKA